MKQTSIYIAAILVFSAIMSLNSCTPKTGETKTTDNTIQAATGGAKIAYVNIDSLEEHYELLKSRREDFKKRQEQMEAELQQSYQQMQNRGQEIQKKVQSQSISQSEYQAAEKEIMKMQQSLESRKQSLTETLMKEQEDFNKDLKKRLDAYLESYNKDKHYDFILSYSSAGGSPIMYANKQLEITKDIIAGMNATSVNGAGVKKY